MFSAIRALFGRYGTKLDVPVEFPPVMASETSPLAEAVAAAWNAPRPVIDLDCEMVPAVAGEALPVLAHDPVTQGPVHNSERAPTRAKRARSTTYTGYDDFQADWGRAKALAFATDQRWSVRPESFVYARIPAKWTRVRVFGRVITGPRDVKLPVGEYWPSGALPVGPEY